MAAIKLVRVSGSLGLVGQVSDEVLSKPSLMSAKISRPKTVMCLKKIGLSSENLAGGAGERKLVEVKAGGPASCVLISEPKTTDKVVDLGSLLANVSNIISHWLKCVTTQRPWRLHIQMFVEKVIIDCRFFTLLGIGGSLLGSVLCFVEGCALILESYFQYFHAISQKSQQGHILLLLIEAIDMFLVGIAMLVFGMSLHVMFVGSKTLKGKRSQHSGSTLSKFNFEKLLGMESVGQAKSKIGHAVIVNLQVQVLEKFKSVPVVNVMDLACFAGVLLLSSASIFVLSKIGVRARAEVAR